MSLFSFLLTNEEQASDKTRYIQVDIGKNKKNQNVEKWSETDKINFLKENADNELTRHTIYGIVYMLLGLR